MDKNKVIPWMISTAVLTLVVVFLLGMLVPSPTNSAVAEEQIQKYDYMWMVGGGVVRVNRFDEKPIPEIFDYEKRSNKEGWAVNKEDVWATITIRE